MESLNMNFHNFPFFAACISFVQNGLIQIVASSMCPEQTTPAWCDQCRKYQPTNQTRKLRSLPKVLSLNAGMVTTFNRRYANHPKVDPSNDNLPKK